MITRISSIAAMAADKLGMSLDDLIKLQAKKAKPAAPKEGPKGGKQGGKPAAGGRGGSKPSGRGGQQLAVNKARGGAIVKVVPRPPQRVSA